MFTSEKRSPSAACRPRTAEIVARRSVTGLPIASLTNASTSTKFSSTRRSAGAARLAEASADGGRRCWACVTASAPSASTVAKSSEYRKRRSSQLWPPQPLNRLPRHTDTGNGKSKAQTPKPKSQRGDAAWIWFCGLGFGRSIAVYSDVMPLNVGRDPGDAPRGCLGGWLLSRFSTGRTRSQRGWRGLTTGRT